MAVVRVKEGTTSSPVSLDGEHLTVGEVVRVARYRATTRLSPEGRRRMGESWRMVEELVSANRVVYGITTGFGKFSNVTISEEDTDRLQRNLIMSHAGGVGDPYEVEVVRAIMLLRANSLAKGYSGIRPEVVETLIDMLNKGVHPVVPQKGSVGASGDLAPLSHVALVMIGLGEAYFRGERMSGARAMEMAGIQPVQLKAKEGLALINGTQVMGALASLGVYDALLTWKSATIAAALSVEALNGIPAAFDEKIHRVRPHQGQSKTAAFLRRLLEGGEVASRSTHPRVQDAYSLRCIPQVHGASLDAINYVEGIVDVENNSATDNPLLFPDEGEVLSGGNFHGEPLALAMDFLGIAVAELGSISERRIERMVNPQLSGLPAFLTRYGGLNSGMMIGQYTAAALVSENKVLASPACVDSIPTSANQEDHVSMGSISSRKAREIIKNVQQVIAIELLCAAQGIDFYGPRQLGKGTGRAHEVVRFAVPALGEDRVLYPDLQKALSIVRDGTLAAAVEEALD